jgi:hypothetical protein
MVFAARSGRWEQGAATRRLRVTIQTLSSSGVAGAKHVTAKVRLERIDAGLLQRFHSSLLCAARNRPTVARNSPRAWRFATAVLLVAGAATGITLMSLPRRRPTTPCLSPAGCNPICNITSG